MGVGHHPSVAAFGRKPPSEKAKEESGALPRRRYEGVGRKLKFKKTS